MRYSFSGHETFTCKQYWLKKGLDFLASGNKFSDDNAVVGLGVGKNMVSSIRFWLKAFGMVDNEDQPTELAEFLFGENGVDPYLEDSSSLWLLHHQLIKEKKSSIYDLAFNRIRHERPEFTKEQFVKSLATHIQANGDSFSPNTIANDLKVFLNNYLVASNTEVEESFSGVLQELNLIDKYQARDYQDKKVDWFRFLVSDKSLVPCEIILYTIVDNPAFGKSISFRDLMFQENSPGNIFLITESGLREKLKEMAQIFSVTFTETAGNQVFQIKGEINKWDVLRNYYGSDEY